MPLTRLSSFPEFRDCFQQQVDEGPRRLCNLRHGTMGDAVVPLFQETLKQNPFATTTCGTLATLSRSPFLPVQIFNHLHRGRIALCTSGVSTPFSSLRGRIVG